MNDPLLIAVSVQSITPQPIYPGLRDTPHIAKIRGVSNERDGNFVFTSGLIIGEALRRCRLLHEHGFTVVEAPPNWPYAHDHLEGGRNHTIILIAMEKMAGLYSGRTLEVSIEYDEAFAGVVLSILNKAFPRTVQLIDIKSQFDSEPNDEQLLLALDGLIALGLATGTGMRDHSTGDRRLVALANIQITAAGRKHLTASVEPASQSTVVHGGQYNNYGQTGAMGQNATGTLSYQQQWIEIAGQMNTSALHSELEQLRQYLLNSATSRSDYQQIGLIAEAEEEAEKGDGGKVMQVLSKLGKGVFDCAKDVGTDVAAKVIAKAIGLEP